MSRVAKRGEAQAWARSAARHTGDDCLLWPFKAVGTNGYGTIRTAGRKMVGAHRLVCKLAHGAPPSSGLECAHSCGIKLCCNPNHLRWTTHPENEADKARHGTNNIGSRNGAAKLTASAVWQIREKHARGASGRSLAKHYAVSPAAISLIVNGLNWAWL